MHFLEFSFYLLSVFVLGTAAVAVTRRNRVHAVVSLILSLVGLALLFYLLGAPLLAVLEIILYAGAIMVLFLFVVMMFGSEQEAGAQTFGKQWLLPALVSLFSGAVLLLLLAFYPGATRVLAAAQTSPRNFGRLLFQNYWFGVELLSFLLFVALVGALYLGGRERAGRRMSRHGGGS
jgi:NADH-quinone oxidoreductase subunit J